MNQSSDTARRPPISIPRRVVRHIRRVNDNGRLSGASILRMLLLVVGCVLVISSSFRNWFDVPTAIFHVQHYDEIVRQAPDCQRWFQGCMGIGLVLFGWIFILKRNQSLAGTLVACGIVFVALAFPYFAMMQSPVLAADATWLQMQHDNLTWLGGDINLQAEAGTAAWKSKVYWVDPPRQIAVAPLPTWSAWEMGLDKIEDVLIWCGYSNVFCQFVRGGWFHAVIGSCLLALVTLLPSKTIDLKRAGYGILLLLLTLGAGAVYALSGPFLSKTHLNNAANELRKGNHRGALSELKKCEQRFPVLTQDTYYISQRALLEFQSGIVSNYASLHQAKKYEASGCYDQSFEIWRTLCESPDVAIRREALRAVLRFAIHDYNCHRIRLAKQRLLLVLGRQPASPKVVYYLQIIGIREQAPGDVYQMCDWMHTITDHLNFSSTKILKAVSQQNAKLAAAIDNDAMETWVRTIEGR